MVLLLQVPVLLEAVGGAVVGVGEGVVEFDPDGALHGRWALGMNVAHLALAVRERRPKPSKAEAVRAGLARGSLLERKLVQARELRAAVAGPPAADEGLEGYSAHWDLASRQRGTGHGKRHVRSCVRMQEDVISDGKLAATRGWASRARGGAQEQGAESLRTGTTPEPMP